MKDMVNLPRCAVRHPGRWFAHTRRGGIFPGPMSRECARRKGGKRQTVRRGRLELWSLADWNLTAIDLGFERVDVFLGKGRR